MSDIACQIALDVMGEICCLPAYATTVFGCEFKKNKRQFLIDTVFGKNESV
ncbi:unnamed protein product, partial [Durusdinium trenchii]